MYPIEKELLKPSVSAEPSWLKDLRTLALSSFGKQGFSSLASDAWKYSFLDDLLKKTYSPNAISKKNYAVLADYGIDPRKSFVLCFVNGVLLPGTLAEDSQHPGFILESLRSAVQHNRSLSSYLGTRVLADENPFSLANLASFNDGVFLYVPNQTEIKKPIHLVFIQDAQKTSEPLISQPRILIVAGEGSKVSVTVDHLNVSDGDFLHNGVCEIHLAARAHLKAVQIFRGGENGTYLIKNQVVQKQSSGFRMETFVQGSQMIRQENVCELEGEGADCHLDGFGLLDKKSRFFQSTSVHHLVPGCTSKQLFKNILFDRAVAECSSLVHVIRNAQKSVSEQLNRNLLFSDTCRVYSRPQLKIYADDVKCSHGSATGQLVKDELFYLRSRGISLNQARLLLAYGFAGEILAQLDDLPIKKRIEESVRKTLESNLLTN